MPTTQRPFFANFFAAFRQHPQLPKPTPGSTSVLTSTNVTSYCTTPLPPSIDSSPASSPTLLPTQPSSPIYGPPQIQATIASAQAAAATFRSSRPLHPPPSVPIPQTRPRSRTRQTQPQHHQQRHHHTHLPPPAIPLALPMPMPHSHGSHNLPSSQYPGGNSPGNTYHTPHSISPTPPSPFATRSRTPSLTRATNRQRRGSESSTEGWGVASAAEKWYIGGRTAGGEERFYKLGLVRRYGSEDRLSLDRLSI